MSQSIAGRQPGQSQMVDGSSLGTRVRALATIPRHRNRPYNLIPFIVAFLASGNDNLAYLGLGSLALFLYSFVQDYSNLSGDRIEDAVNRPERGVLARKAGGYQAVFRASLVSLLFFCLTLVAMVMIGGLSLAWAMVWLSGPLLALNYSYGSRAKSSTWFSPIAHSFIPSLPLLLGWVGSRSAIEILPYAALLFVVRFSNAGLGFKDIDDLEGDRRIGYRSVFFRYIESRHPTVKALPVLLAPFALLTVLGASGSLGTWWPLAFVMLAVALPWLRILLSSRTPTEGKAVRELGNFYQLTWISIMCFDLHPYLETWAIAAAGIVWYVLMTLTVYADKGDLSRVTLSAAYQVLRTGQSAARQR